MPFSRLIPIERLAIAGDDVRSLRWSTIHEAKGWEYDAVLPPDRGDARNTSKLLDVWENRVDEEAKRVIYVGV
jgi:DNA helicase II / ATP-dependent DNA helicase PcrA